MLSDTRPTPGLPAARVLRLLAMRLVALAVVAASHPVAEAQAALNGYAFAQAGNMTSTATRVIGNNMVSWRTSVSDSRTMAEATSWATYGAIHAEITRNPGAFGGGRSDWTDSLTVSGAGLSGATGVLKASFFISSLGSEWDLNVQDLVRVGEGPSSNFAGRIDFSVPITFGKSIQLSGLVRNSFVGFGPDRMAVTMAWDGVSAVELADGTRLDLNQLTFASASGTDYRDSSLPLGSDPDHPQLPGDRGQIGLPPQPGPIVICPQAQSACARWTGTFVDPDVAVGFDYLSLSNARFTEIYIPYDYGDGKFELWAWDETLGQYIDSGHRFGARQVVKLTEALGTPDGLSRFSVRGIEVSAAVDPDNPEAFVTGLSWNGDGTGGLKMTPVVASVPEANPATLLVFGLAAMTLCTWRRRVWIR